ncbi:hypothetical protein WME94_42205 [Sorangium sp. So ce429]
MRTGLFILGTGIDLCTDSARVSLGNADGKEVILYTLTSSMVTRAARRRLRAHADVTIGFTSADRRTSASARRPCRTA